MGQAEYEVLLPSDLMNLVGDFLEEARHDPTLPQFKDRDALIDYAIPRFIEKHSATPLTLRVPNGIKRFYLEHERWLQVNDGVGNFNEWLSLAIRSYAVASIDALYKHEEKQELLSEYGIAEN